MGAPIQAGSTPAASQNTHAMKLSQIKPNPNNPRLIKDERFEKLCKSIQEAPKFMALRPIIVDANGMILGGNMRYKALLHLGYKEVPDEWVKRADDLTEDERRRFIISDNVGFGEWEWETVANEWDVEELADWGLDVPDFEPALNYDLLKEGDGLDSKLKEMQDGVKKAIQIEFEPEHYDEAFELVKFWRNQGLYIGGFIIEKLKQEKEAL
jgi:ParB-like chromosome segregation protein Spo0J